MSEACTPTNRTASIDIMRGVVILLMMLDSVSWIGFGAMLLIVVDYPVAKAFAGYKHKKMHNQPWLSYL